MSIKQQELPISGIGQSPGCDPKTTKRSSVLISFFKWFKPSTSRESVTQEVSSSSSSDSINSITSTGTIASFSFISPEDYKATIEKNIVLGPETDTYRARLKQRDKRRENDKDLTLRKKYNLFFNRDTLFKITTKPIERADNSKSLPLMTRKMETEEEKAHHRRTNSESSKLKKAGAYCHVKGKRRAPQPPLVVGKIDGNNSTMSLRRKKRLAPQPPTSIVTQEKIINTLENSDNKYQYDTVEYADADVFFNDSLKLDHGILKPTNDAKNINKAATSTRPGYMEAPVSPRPWYKRNLSRDGGVMTKYNDAKIDDKYEPIGHFSDVLYRKTANVGGETKSKKRKDEKRKSGLSFLTNISELDREALEIIKKEHEKDLEPPPFMRPKQEPSKCNNDSWVSPKRRSTRDLIAKFNAITGVTKVTVNSTFFGVKDSGALFQRENIKREYFGKPTISINNKECSTQTKTKISSVSPATNTCTEIDCNKNNAPVVKSEGPVITIDKEKEEEVVNKEPFKFEKNNWYCPKCALENEYWRIICYVCSTIKPYFDDLTTPTPKNNTLEKNKTENSEVKRFQPDSAKNTLNVKPGCDIQLFERHLERSRTQIGFSALAKYNEKNKKIIKSSSVDETVTEQKSPDKQEEKERLKKMLIDMKNSLPKRRINNLEKQNSRTSIIQEHPENKHITKVDEDVREIPNFTDEPTIPVEKRANTAEVLIVTQEARYENIKVKRTDSPKPIKITISAQTSAVAREPSIIQSISGAIQKQETKKNFKLLRPHDFANIYNTKSEKLEHVYSNLIENRDVYLKMQMKFSEISNNDLAMAINNTDTLEINRLLKRLETAIAKGELSEASKLARDLAHLKVNCSVVRQKSIDGKEKSKSSFMVDMYVEDKISHRGPFPINVTDEQTVTELKTQIENDFQIPAQVQKWILGKELASDDNAALKDLHVMPGCPVFLYLVAPTNAGYNRKTEKDIKLAAETLVNLKSGNIISKDVFQNGETKYSKEDEKTFALNLPEAKTPLLKASDFQSKLTELDQVPIPSSSTEEPPYILLPKSAPLALNEEDIEEGDTKTLKPQERKWECIMCTFFNSQNTNICAICATINSSTISASPKSSKAEEQEQHYLQLINLDNSDLVETTQVFECLICLTDIPAHNGVTLRECLHQFCKECLVHTIEFTEEAEVKCPYRDHQYSCDTSLQDREIKALVAPAVYDQFLAKSVAQAENKIDKSFHCKTPDCKGWCIFEDNVNEFHCPVCRKTNCLTCQAIHMRLNCKQYQGSLNESLTDENAERTKEMLEEMVKKGEGIKCPTCQVILMKKWGCDWLRCSMCKTEICWVTRGPRWGPRGKGDTSGGCQCGVNGVKCHPQCNYCH